MWLKRLFLLVGLASGFPVFASDEPEHQVEDIPYGTSLYEFYQGKELAAITELAVGQYREQLKNKPEDGQLLLGGLYFSYGLPDEAEQSFLSILEKETSVDTQDRVWYNLGRINYYLHQDEKSLQQFSRIQQTLSPNREAQKNHLLTNLYLRDAQYEQAALSTGLIPDKSIWKGYSLFNLGARFLQEGKHEQASDWMSRLYNQDYSDEEWSALKDHAALAIGVDSLQRKQSQSAIENLQRVKLKGPQSNKALLGIGWAWGHQENYDKALTYWSELRDRNQGDRATHESIVAIPFAIEQKGNKAQAVQYYDRAAGRLDQVVIELDEAIDSVRQGELMEVLESSRLLAGRYQTRFHRVPPDTPVTRFLSDLFASEKFQQALREYQELQDMEHTLLSWQQKLPTYQLMLNERRATFEQKKPRLEQFTGFAHLDSIQQQRDELTSVVGQIEKNNDHLILATEEETDYLDQIEFVDALINKLSSQGDYTEQEQKLQLFRGLMEWQISIDFPQRFWRVKRELQLLDRALEEAKTSAASLAGASNRHDENLNGLQQRIAGQQVVIEQTASRVGGLVEAQRQQITQLALKALEQHKQQVIQLRLATRYSLARLYDDLSNEIKEQETGQ